VRRVGLAALLGLCLALSMPPVGWWPLAVVAVAGLTLLCRGRSLGAGAVLGGAFGFVFVLVAMWWLRTVVPGVQFGIALAESPFYVLLGVALSAVSRLPGWPVLAASVWLAVEVLRSTVPFGGLPWARLGTAFADTPVVAWARYVGEGGLTLVIALGCCLLAAAVATRRRRVAAATAASAVVIVGGAAVLPVGLQGPSGRMVTVAVVQGDVPGQGIDSFLEPRVTLENHAAATRELAAAVRAGESPRPDLVIWPENASDVDPLRDRAAGALIQQAVDDVGVPVLVGAVTRGPGADEVQGRGIVWEPGTGPADDYAKRRLVPFGEWVPFRTAVTPIVPLLAEEIPRDFVPGDHPGIVEVGPATVGSVMCFEVAFDSAIREVTGDHVDLLAVQTNNATYLGSGQLEQQWAITRLRAVETGRAVAVAATTGISGIIGPDGEVVERTTSRDRQVIVAEVPMGEGRTIGIRWGGWLELAVVALAVLAAGVAVVRRRDQRWQESSGESSSSSRRTTRPATSRRS
jgi:apolipoprotein N-acyltransferase